MWFPIFLIFVSLTGNAIAFEASGLFYVGVFGDFGNIYRYNVQNLKCATNFYQTHPLRCTDLEVITGVTGNPVAGYTNAMVKGLGIHDQSINFMPSGFEKYFPNIIGLELANSNVKVIRKQDLSPFKFLQEIVMHGNRFESLELDTFEGNPDLVNIYFANNDFKYLDPKTFAPLPKLKLLDLTSNRCINTRATTPQQISELKVEMALKCKSARQIAKLEAEVAALKRIVMQFVGNDNQAYCKMHLKMVGQCTMAASDYN